MHLRPFIPLLLTLFCLPTRGQDTDALMRMADESLVAGLWEIAESHYDTALQSAKLPPDQSARAAIGLAESYIRQGKSKLALDLLDQSIARNHPEHAFWKGLATACSGRLAEAIAQLTPLLEKTNAPHHFETATTVANLHLSLGQTDDALGVLSDLRQSASPSQAAAIVLREVEILIDAQQLTKARSLISSVETFPAELQAHANFLNAHLTLAENNASAAAGMFKALVDAPRGLGLMQFHMAAVGLADSLLQSEGPASAFAFLASFIGEHPDSPQLEALFHLIEKTLPQKPLPGDPMLTQLGEWIPPSEISPTGFLPTYEGGCSSAWPTAKVREEIIAYALFTRALALDRSDSPLALAESRALMNRLRAEFPSHPLVNRTLLLSGKRHLMASLTDQAFQLLTMLRENSTLSEQRGEAAFLQAREAYQKGDLAPAAKLFEEAANELGTANANISRFNSQLALVLDHAKSDSKFTTIANINDPALNADMELERAMAAKSPTEKKQAVEKFLNQHPDHPRANEARLVAAHAALDQAQPDVNQARSHLDVLTSQNDPSQRPPMAQLAWLKLRISSLQNQLPEVIANATELIEQFPTEPVAEDAAMLLGRAHFESRNYNDARLILEKIATSTTNRSRAQAAWLLSARAATLVQTPQSRHEALALYTKAAEADSPLASVARLEMARLMIDMNQSEDAVKLLRPWFASLTNNDPIQHACGLLLGDAIQALGIARPEALTEALEIYDRLLANSPRNSVNFNHLQYLRGRTLEQIPNKPDSLGHNEQQALLAYYSVLETTNAPAEWNYLELCGFRALAILEKSQRWPAAIACARKIASFKGPRADEANQRAEQIRLKNMIWED